MAQAQAADHLKHCQKEMTAQMATLARQTCRTELMVHVMCMPVRTLRLRPTRQEPCRTWAEIRCP